LRVTDAHTEHCIAWFELRDVPAHRFNLAGHINPESGGIWLAQSGHYATAAFHYTLVQWIDGSRANFYQDFIVPGNRLFDLLDLDNIRGTVPAIDGGFHVRTHAALACSFL
jgi:hypothetical protein